MRPLSAELTGGRASPASHVFARRSIAALALALSGPALVVSGPAQAQILAGPSVSGIGTIIYCAPPEGGRREAPDTVSGWVHVPDEPIRVIAEGLTRVPAVPGLGFGVEYLLNLPGPVDVVNITEHPPMAPDGVTRQSWTTLSPGQSGHASLFQFDTPEELLTGRWTLSAEAAGETLFSVEFEVVPADQMSDLAAQCRGAGMLSRLMP